MIRPLSIAALLGCAPAAGPTAPAAGPTTAPAAASTPVAGASSAPTAPAPASAASSASASTMASTSALPASGASDTFEPMPDKPKAPYTEKLGLTTAQIKGTIDPVRPQLKKCGEGGGGRVVLVAQISPKGKVSVAIESSTATHPATTCAVKLFESLQFPSSEAGARIKLPVTFTQ